MTDDQVRLYSFYAGRRKREQGIADTVEAAIAVGAGIASAFSDPKKDDDVLAKLRQSLEKAADEIDRRALRELARSFSEGRFVVARSKREGDARSDRSRDARGTVRGSPQGIPRRRRPAR